MSFFVNFFKKGSQNFQPGKWRAGDKIGGFFEVQQIFGGEGKSGMGIVYICFVPKLGMTVALKTFQDKYILSKSNQELFRREALIWSTELGDHPCVVSSYGATVAEDRFFILLEYIAPDNEGKNTLTHYLEGLTFSDILIFSVQFCYGMEYIYSRGIDCHRDIKPDNIMITADKTVKITDFGLAKAFQEIQLKEEVVSSSEKTGLSIFQTKDGKRVCGTLQYMSPEQFDGYVDRRSDIYSFGVTLYQMVTGGRFPFAGSTPQEYEELHKYKKVPAVSSPLFSVIQKCLEKNPDKRYQDFASIREELEKLFKELTGKKLVIKIEEKPSENVNSSQFNFEGVDFEIDGKSSELANKANNLLMFGKFKEAFNLCEEATKQNPKDILAWTTGGYALYILERYDEALIYVEKALRLNQNFSHTINLKELIVRKLGM